MGNKSDRLLIQPIICLNEKYNLNLNCPILKIKPKHFAKSIEKFIINYRHHFQNLDAFGITFIVTHIPININSFTFSSFPEIYPLDPQNKKKYIFIEYTPIRYINKFDLETISTITHADTKNIKDLIDPLISDQLFKIRALESKYQSLFA